MYMIYYQILQNKQQCMMLHMNKVFLFFLQ